MVDFSEKAGAEKQALLGSLDPSLPLKLDFQVQDGAVIRGTTSTHPQRYQNRWRRIKSMASIFTLGALTVAALLYYSAPGGSSCLFLSLTNQNAHSSTDAMGQQVKGYFQRPALLYSIKHAVNFSYLINIWIQCWQSAVGDFATNAKKKNLCLSSECVHAASEILYNLSPDYKNIDPCTNFEELVCGGWRDRHDLREDQGDAFTGTIMAENSQLLLKHILEAPYPKDSMVRQLVDTVGSD